ncbi:DNA gyrase inhibitor YacG [Bosea sp. 117]|uniref:DNA gyrase inhibitor YacG n=1 Tax=Bosea sp. 117 TaxID=1125973 RepID=UPI00056E7089|nr:DNA gyrase inhibitor YacG [Bosea sp. 117]
MKTPRDTSPGKPLPGTACPICGKPAVETYKPFCSSRCADVDLHRWLSGAYAIPASEEDDEDDAAPLAPDAPKER